MYMGGYYSNNGNGLPLPAPYLIMLTIIIRVDQYAALQRKYYVEE